ncbi:MAG: MarR family winged helix-turn-helix transcriptional regulator, partial [Steroidobacteraceae bacterium]
SAASKRTPSKRKHQDLSASVLRSFRMIYGSVRQHFREVRRSCGISGSQIWILHELAKADGIGVSDLAAKLSIHQSTCSQLVEKLVRAGYVTKTRRTTDQRRVEVAISRAGRRLLERAPAPHEGVLPEAIAELSRTQLHSLQRNLQSVIAALDLKDEGAADRPLADM